MTKVVRRTYTLEYKREAVQLVKSGRRVADAARSLEISEQTLSNWLKADQSGKLNGPARGSTLTTEQMEIRRLRAENAQLKMERDILGKATAYFAKGQK
jgi:transposase